VTGVAVVDIKFSQFFDRAAVIEKVEDGTKSVLAKAGAFVRTRAKSSIRSRKKPATPGTPPSSHTGILKNLILFGYEPATESVVIGPKLFRSANPTGPELLEYGGNGKTLAGKPAIYQKFPFMEPALEAERDHFAELFSNAIKG
jgi:hypothetical protein